MPLPTIACDQDLMANLVHDLRQPLGNIGISVFLLNMVTGADDRVRAQLHVIESQLQDAVRMLAEASAALSPKHPQRAADTEGLDRTNSATMAVT